MRSRRGHGKVKEEDVGTSSGLAKTLARKGLEFLKVYYTTVMLPIM
jgi:hypothetical protein